MFTSLVEIIRKDEVESSFSVGRHTAEQPATVRQIHSLKWRTSLAPLHLHFIPGGSAKGRRQNYLFMQSD